MKLKIVQIGDPVLEQKANKIKDFKDPKLQELIDNMIDTCNAELDKTAGLSAPQVGIPVAVSLCRRFDKGENSKEWEVMINPEITSKSTQLSSVWEGCLSVGKGDKTLYGPVTRSRRVRVEYFDRKGQSKSLDVVDYFSHVVQHELDHLEGILFIKHVPNPDQNLWTSKELDDYLERYSEFPPIG